MGVVRGNNVHTFNNSIRMYIEDRVYKGGRMGQYIEAINREESRHGIRLFLGGTITGAPDWQSEAVERLIPYDITLYNPRRKNFPIEDSGAAREQIEWEFEMLGRVTDIFFWFSKETLGPIVLYELGRHLALRKSRIHIGIEKGYQREQDIRIQTGLALGVRGYVIVDSIERLCNRFLQERYWENR